MKIHSERVRKMEPCENQILGNAKRDSGNAKKSAKCEKSAKYVEILLLRFSGERCPPEPPRSHTVARPVDRASIDLGQNPKSGQPGGCCVRSFDLTEINGRTQQPPPCRPTANILWSKGGRKRAFQRWTRWHFSGQCWTRWHFAVKVPPGLTLRKSATGSNIESGKCHRVQHCRVNVGPGGTFPQKCHRVSAREL